VDSEIRTATVDDLERINNVYNSYIVGKNTSFDTEPWSMKARIAWFEKYRQGEQYQVLVAASDHRTIGFAASSPFRSKTAYDSSVETTVVLEESATGQGLGTDLLAELLARIRPTGVHRRTR
jgi:phosphinothricin acetyltransferase